MASFLLLYLHMHCRILYLLALTQLGIGTSELLAANNFFISLDGTPSGDGSRSNAWNFATGITNTSVIKPGDTLWLTQGTYGRGGNYSCSFTVSGTPTNPVTLRQVPGQRAIINGTLHTTGSNQVLWGFEIMNSACANTRTQSISGIGPGLSMEGHGAKAINLTIHDTGAPGLWLPVASRHDREIYGCVIWGCGDYEPPQYPTRGPNVYMQNESNTVHVTDNISFKSWTEGLKSYGQDSALSLTAISEAFNYQGNVLFLNNLDGICADSTHHAIQSLNVVSNYYFNNGESSLGGADNDSIGLALDSPSTGTNHQHLTFANNYFVDEAISTYSTLLNFKRWSFFTMTNNVFAEASTNATYKYTLLMWKVWLTNVVTTTVDYNTYYGLPNNIGVGGEFAHGSDTNRPSRRNWQFIQSALGWEANGVFHTNTWPKTNAIVLRTNKYESGRANLVIYNWLTNSTVTVDISGIGLQHGQRIEVRDVQNYFGTAAVTTTYDTARPTITVPLTLTKATSLIGTQTHFRRDPNLHTSSLFNAFVILPMDNNLNPASNLRRLPPGQQ